MHLGIGVMDLFGGKQESTQREESRGVQAKSEIRSAPLELSEPGSDYIRQSPVSSQKSEDVTRILQDGSRLSRMKDGYGNSTVTRSFRGHDLLRMVMVRDHGNGQRQVFVYGKNGQVESLSSEYSDQVLSLTPAEIAKAAKINDSFSEKQRREQRISVIRDRQRDELREKRRAETPRYAEPADIGEAGENELPADEIKPNSENQSSN
ncbi:MAG: hypothetical protein OEQ28_04580 [Acidobacteriota bacterium]|nr:hypothetical protein [Acidobacteriota bacterium]